MAQPRSQCEAERLVRAAGEKLDYASKALEAGAVGAGKAGAVGVAAVLGGASKVVDVFEWFAGNKADRLEVGCKLEKIEEGKKEAAAAARGTAGSGTGGDGHSPAASGHVHCHEIYIRATTPAGDDGNGDILINGGRFAWVCTPIVLDLDGDGIEYRTIDSPILTDSDHDGRLEQRAWVGSDDGLLFWDANNDGLGSHHETVLAGFVDGAKTDLDALRAFDGNDDGAIDAADAYYASLKVGRDLNQNGQFEANEVFTLAQLGIARIDLVAGVQAVNDPRAPVEKAPGVVEYNLGQFVRTNGTVGRFSDAGLEEKAYSVAVYSDASVSIISYGATRGWVQKAASPVQINLATATYAGHSNFIDFIGNAGNDIVYGSEAGNLLYGGGGSDRLYGQGGDDTIVADDADMAGGWAEGGVGNDTLVLDGATGAFLDASARSFENVLGTSGGDRFLVSSSVLGTTGVVFFGREGNDSLEGGLGDDTLVGGAGADTLLGGAGDDVVTADYDDLVQANVQGGDGFDTLAVDTTSGVTVDGYARGFEIMFGGSGGDYLYSSSTAFWENDITLYGQGGDDRLTGGAGHDYLVGGPGSDVISGGAGDDIIVIDRYDSLANINGGGGSYGKGDTLVFDDTVSLYVANLSHMNILGAVGGDGNDTIYASRSDSLYWHERFDNFLAGGKGDDFLYGGAGSDVYTWNAGDGNDVFQDRDYGEYRGDVVHLGEGVTAAEVTIRNVGGVQSIHIAGQGAGSVRLSGFAMAGPADKIVVEGIAHDLNALLSRASTYGYEGILLTTWLPASYGGGTGGTSGGTTGGGGGGSTGGTGGYTGGPGEREPPIVLDLDGDGIELISASRSNVYFDWDGDGVKDRTGWAGPDDAFLVLDRNGDGQISNADEIAFGEVSDRKGPFISDLEALRAFDTNGNGSLDIEDEAFGEFAIWQDANSNGTVDSGEMQSVAEAGLQALSLNGYLTGESLRGRDNVVYATSEAVFSDDRTVTAGDVLLGYKLSATPESFDAAFRGGQMNVSPEPILYLV